MKDNSMLASYRDRLTAALGKSDMDALRKVADRLLLTKSRSGTVFTAGNGGSAATASHFVNDLIKGCRVCTQTGLRAQCFCDSTSVVTCLANDFSYEDIFTVQLETLAREGDILVCFSGSGNSTNVINVVKRAKGMGIFTIGFTGNGEPNELAALADLCVRAPTADMEMIEDLHMIYTHDIVCAVREELSGMSR